MEIGVHKVAMAAPSEVSELERLIAAGTVAPAAIVALIGKTEGNGAPTTSPAASRRCL